MSPRPRPTRPPMSPPGSPAAAALARTRDASRFLAIAAPVVVAYALRIWHVRVGLPDFGEEAIPFRRALAMWGWETGRPDWSPHFFHYPSLSLYLHHLLQRGHVAWGLLTGGFANANDYYLRYQIDPTPMVVLARLLGMTADAATVVGVAVMGERIRRGAGLAAATLVAFAPVMILTSRAIQADPLMTAFAVWAVERMLAYHDRGGARRLAAALVLIGLATGTKYTAVALIVPLAWVLARRLRWRALPVGVVAVAAVGAVVLTTSPYILADLPTFVRDVGFIRELPEEGHFGNLERRAFLFHLGRLGGDLGWLAVLLLGISLVTLPLRRPVRGWAIVLWLALLAFAVPISLARIDAARYLVPVIPIAAILIAVAAMTMADLAPPGLSRPLRVALAAALLMPVIIGGGRAAGTGADSTQLEARRWCEAHVSGNELLLQEAYGVSLPAREVLARAAERRPVRLASAPLRERFLARRGYRVVTLPLSVAGRCVSRVRGPGGGWVELEIFPHPADFNRVFYDPRLLIGVDHLLTSDAVRGRFEADPVRYAAAAGFYRLLDGIAEVEARFRPRAGVVGPAITLYRLGPRTDSLIAVRYGALDAFWWAASIPARYRSAADALLGVAAGSPTPRVTDDDGRAAPWVTSLAEVFEERLHRFSSAMADELTSLDRCEPAARHAAASLAMAPADLEDCLAFSACAGRLGRWREGRLAVERALATAAAGTPEIPYLRLEHARFLVQSGDFDFARAELREVMATEGADAAVTAAARKGLEDLE